MKNLILILFVLLSKVCLGQSLSSDLMIVDNEYIKQHPEMFENCCKASLVDQKGRITLETLENRDIGAPKYYNSKKLDYEEYQKYAHRSDSIILILKNRLDSLEADYDKILYKLILNETEKYNGRK